MNVPASINENALAKYDAACRAIAEAKAVDEIKTIMDTARAMAAAARIAEDKQALADLTAIQLRAKRHLGEMMAAQREAGLMSSGAANAGWKETRVEEKPITLAEAGINKNLAHDARRAAAVPAEVFEEKVEEHRERVAAGEVRASADIFAANTTTDTVAEPVQPAKKSEKQAAAEAFALLTRWNEILAPLIHDLYHDESDDWMGYEAFARKYRPLFAFDYHGTYEIKGREAKALRASILNAIGEAERQLAAEARAGFLLPDAPTANAYLAATDPDAALAPEEPFEPVAFLKRGAA